MDDQEEYDFVPSSSGHHRGANSMFPDYFASRSGKVADLDVQFSTALRSQYPHHTITVAPSQGAPLMELVNLGEAWAELDTKDETCIRWRLCVPRIENLRPEAVFVEEVFFGKYDYRWREEQYIVYQLILGRLVLQYILKEPGDGEHPMSNCRKTDDLIKEAVEKTSVDKFIWVYDGYWYQSKSMWEEVQKSSWDNVILDATTKDSLTKIVDTFFDSADFYHKLGIAWKRGIIFYGPPGNGKTISVKALMNSLYNRTNQIPSLYVKSASSTYDLEDVFQHARQVAPCMVVIEDIETVVNEETRSYFFNELDGMESNDGILFVATTNYLDRLDPGLAKRPSRFDRKYKFPLPDHSERVLYAEFWRKKIQRLESDLKFPEKLCPAIADITDDFSFAYMQEAFVGALLMIAREDSDEDEETSLESPQKSYVEGVSGVRDPDHEELNKYKLWRAMKKEVEMLRKDMKGKTSDRPDQANTNSEEILNSAVSMADKAQRTAPSKDYSTISPKRMSQVTSRQRTEKERSRRYVQHYNMPSLPHADPLRPLSTSSAATGESDLKRAIFVQDAQYTKDAPSAPANDGTTLSKAFRGEHSSLATDRPTPPAASSISVSISCPACTHNVVSYTQTKKPGTDETETTFCECTLCGHRWRY